MKRIALALFVLISACDVSTGDAQRTLGNLGFSDVKLTGHAWFSCGDDYTFSSKFEAKNPNGKTVDGVICCGMLKACTVKF